MYSEEFKKQLVSEFESWKISAPQLEKLHVISNRSIYCWIYKYSNFNEQGYRIMEMKESSTSKIRDLENRIRELEWVVARNKSWLTIWIRW